MSRKTKKNPPDRETARAALPSPTAAGHVDASKRNIFIASALVMLLALVAAVIYYKVQQAQSSELAPPKNQAALESAHSPKFGSPRAKVHIVEFFDPACETCATFFPHVKKLLDEHPGQVRVSVRHVPFHKGADQVVRMLEAARNQDKYLQTLEALYASQGRWAVHHQAQPDVAWQVIAAIGLDLDRLKGDMNSPEVNRRMAQDMDDARTLDVTATPEFFVNGRPLPNFGLDELQNLVKDELRRSYP
jgi:protein-disulfide isomerase